LAHSIAAFQAPGGGQNRQVARSSDDLQAERIGSNETTFRRANEIVKEQAEQAGVEERVPFICECGDDSCLGSVQMNLRDYEAVRSRPELFFVVPGHEILGPDLGKLVGSGDGYNIVEKIGVSAEIARARDDRDERRQPELG
jgi:hypothetical protein